MCNTITRRKKRKKKQSRHHTQCHSVPLTHINAPSFDQRTITLAFYAMAIAYHTFLHPTRKYRSRSEPEKKNEIQ